MFERWFGARREGLVEQRKIGGVPVKIDRAPVVIAIDTLDDRGQAQIDPRPLPRPPFEAASERMVPAALLAHKAKQIDDGIYAAVELAASLGAGKLAGKGALLAGLVRRLAGGAPEPAVATVLAAASVGAPGEHRLPDRMAEAVRAVVEKFAGDPLASKPLGFYTWSPDLERIFARDRLLQQPLEGPAGVAAIVEALGADAALASAYAAHLDLAAKLTNPLVEEKPDLRGRLASPGSPAPRGEAYFFPPSRSREADLVKRMYGDRAVPAGFSLVDEVLKGVRDGSLDLAPTPASGWYDWQSWSLATLAAPKGAKEAAKLALSPAYEAMLADLFRGLFALTRETHVKQLEIETIGCAMGMPRTIEIGPDLRVEPVPTYYLRRALAYRFVRGVLAEALGEDALSRLRGLRAEGPVKAPLAEELREAEALFLGAYAASSADLGLLADADPGAAAALPAFLSWRKKIAGDPDLSADPRMMVPLFYDVERRMTKVLVFLGWTERRISVRFATPPRVDVDPRVSVYFEEQTEQVACPVVVELYVSRLLDRREVRALCDAKRIRSEMVAALSAG